MMLECWCSNVMQLALVLAVNWLFLSAIYFLFPIIEFMSFLIFVRNSEK